MNSLVILLHYLAICLHAVSSLADRHPPPYDQDVDDGAYGFYPVRTYATAEGVTSPVTNFLKWTPACDDGRYYFITPRGWGIQNPSPMILDTNGDLIWARHFDNDFGGQAYDFAVQEYRGQQYLTFWLGDDRVRGHGAGSYYMLNSSYDIVHQITGANGLYADLHEFLITPQGTALLTMYEVIPHDVTEFREFPEDEPAPNYIWDCLFQEIDIATGKLLFQWRASDFVQINDTFHDIGPGGTQNDPFDWFHINSIQKDDLGNYVVSARYPHAIYYIHGGSGEVIWTYGGRNNDFMDLSHGFALNFAWQHDARFLPLDTFASGPPSIYRPPPSRPGLTTRLLSFFDNAAEDQHYDYGLEYSRGMIVELTFPRPGGPLDVAVSDSHRSNTMLEDEGDLNVNKVAAYNGTNSHFTARVVKEYINPGLVRSSSQGSVQVLPQTGQAPKVLVGYGLNAVFTEYDANGTVLCNAHYGSTDSWERGDIQSYRSYKFAWTGRPRTLPSVEIADDEAELYVSWNGATDVSHWILQCSHTDSSRERDWADVVKVGKDGFETTIAVPDDNLGNMRFLRVIAVDENERRLEYGTSMSLDRGIMFTYMPGLQDRLSSDVSPVRGFFILACLTVASFLIYGVYRKYLQHRIGQPSAGAVRWKEGGIYRLLGDA